MNKNLLACFDTQKGRELLDAFFACIDENGMWEKISKGALLAFSGGADSVFLALSLLYLKKEREDFPLLLCHIHHGIRKEGADADLAFSCDFAKEFHLEILSYHFDVPTLAKEKGLGIEECARNVRYSKFQEIYEGRMDVSCILTAHNATDNAETVIHRLLRGTGLRGLCGISPVRDGVIFRPILYISKKDIVQFLDENDISYVTDETNFDTQYTRNYIRNEIFPRFTRIAPTPEVSITRFVQNLREDESCLCDLACVFLKGQDLPFVSTSDFLELPRAIQHRVLQAMASEVLPDFMLQRMHTDLIFKSFENQSRTKLSLASNFYFVNEQGKMFFQVLEPSSVPEVELLLNTPHYSSYFEATFLYCDDEYFKTYKNVHKISTSVSLSSAIINGELSLRGKKSKDFYRVRKMTRKLKTLYQSLHLPSAMTDKIPVICDRNGVLYVPPFGVREDDTVGECSDGKFYIVISYGDGVRIPWQD